MTDINERVVDEWVESTTARERIKEILEETTTYSKVSTIADRARVSEPTTRKYLKELVEEGIGTTEQDGRATLYKRNQGRLVDRRIEELRTTCSHQELVEAVQDMKESIAEFREIYDVESPEDLVIELEPSDEGWNDVGQWQSTHRNLAITKAAIQVDEAHRLAKAEV
jgi:DNA-binding Lrp family transcriptional regulator